MRQHLIVTGILAAATAALAAGTAAAQDIKIGLVAPMTGGQSSVGREIVAADKTLHPAARRHR